MFIIKEIKEKSYIFKYLQERELLNQYKKAKAQILSWNYISNKISYRKPKKDEILYFRINKQFRALARLNWDLLIVFEIDNHQN